MLVMLLMSLLAVTDAPAGLIGHPLGATLESVRSRAATGERLVCSDGGGPAWLPVDPRSAQAGIVRCGFARGRGESAGRAPARLAPGITAVADLWFSEGRLYRIEARAEARYRADLLRLFSRRWGPAAERRERIGGTPEGTTFDASIYEWRSGTRSLTLMAPASAAQPLTVVLWDRSLEPRMELARLPQIM